jgi:hypothetical protein
VGRNQRRRAARANHVCNQPGDPFKAAKQTVPIPSSGNLRELDALAPAFIEWYSQHGFGAEVREVLESLTLFFRFYPEFGETRAITALEPSEVAAKLTSLILNTVYEGITATYCLMQFLRFLTETGRWSGDQESFQAVRGILADIICLDVRATLYTTRLPEHVTTGTTE